MQQSTASVHGAGRTSNVVSRSDRAQKSSVAARTNVALIVDDHLNRVDWLLEKARTNDFNVFSAQGQGELAHVIAEINEIANARGCIFVDAFLEDFGTDFKLLRNPQLPLNDPYIAGFLLVEKVLPGLVRNFGEFTVRVMSEVEKDFSENIRTIEKFPNCGFTTKEVLKENLDTFLDPSRIGSPGALVDRGEPYQATTDELLLIAKGLTKDLGFSPDEVSAILSLDVGKSEVELRAVLEAKDIRLRVYTILDIVELLSMLVGESKVPEYIKKTTDPELGKYSDVLLRGDIRMLFQLKFSLEQVLGGAL